MTDLDQFHQLVNECYAGTLTDDGQINERLRKLAKGRASFDLHLRLRKEYDQKKAQVDALPELRDKLATLRADRTVLEREHSEACRALVLSHGERVSHNQKEMIGLKRAIEDANLAADHLQAPEWRVQRESAMNTKPQTETMETASA